MKILKLFGLSRDKHLRYSEDLILGVELEKNITIVCEKQLISKENKLSMETNKIFRPSCRVFLTKNSKIILPPGTIFFYEETKSCVSSSEEINVTIEKIYKRNFEPMLDLNNGFHFSIIFSVICFIAILLAYYLSENN